MNLIDKIKLLWKLRTFVSEEVQEAKKMNGTKPGYQSTEFWLQLATQIGTLWGAISGFIPPKYAAILSAGGIAVYTVARTVIKAIGDIKAAQATQTVVATTQPVTTITTPG